jgi:hypothetical protein
MLIIEAISYHLSFLELQAPNSQKKNQLHTGVNIDSRIDRADFVLDGLVCATAQVEPSVVLVLKGSNRRDKRRSGDDGGLHFDFRMVMDPVVF